MPCYQISVISVQFSVNNIDLLKKAIEKIGWMAGESYNDKFSAYGNIGRDKIVIDLANSTISSPSFDAKGLTDFSNKIKRAYSEIVIDQIAAKQKWIKRNMGQGNFQLQRF